MSNRAKTLQNLYKRHKVTKEGLQKAVQDGTITPEEYFVITGEVYPGVEAPEEENPEEENPE